MKKLTFLRLMRVPNLSFAQNLLGEAKNCSMLLDLQKVAPNAKRCILKSCLAQPGQA